MKRPPIKNKVKKSDGPLPMTHLQRVFERQTKLNIQRRLEYDNLQAFYAKRKKDRLDGLYSM
jgi:hypothetical protein